MPSALSRARSANASCERFAASRNSRRSVPNGERHSLSFIALPTRKERTAAAYEPAESNSARYSVLPLTDAFSNRPANSGAFLPRVREHMIAQGVRSGSSGGHACRRYVGSPFLARCCPAQRTAWFGTAAEPKIVRRSLMVFFVRASNEARSACNPDDQDAATNVPAC
jgi:hypothetical protein